MTVQITPIVVDEPKSLRTIVRRLGGDWLSTAGGVLLLLIVAIAAFAPLLAPFPEQGLGQTAPESPNLAPSAEHWFGTDQLGRDLLSRVIMGAPPALAVSFTVVLAAMVIGTVLGAFAGYVGGWLDDLLMRLTELFQAFPPLFLAMLTVALMGASLENAGIALAIAWWPWYARLVRAETRALRDRLFVEAARAIGVPMWRVLVRHVLRNAVTPILVQATIDIGSVIMAAGALAFIGLGARPPAPDWGLMVADGRAAIFDAWWISTFPGLAICLTVLAFNLVGDGLRDAFDPRGRR